MFVLPFITPTVVMQATPAPTQTTAPSAPAAPTPTPTSTSTSTPPPPPSSPPIDPATSFPVQPTDPTTGRPLPPLDATGQPILQRDATGQPLIPHDETGQIVEGPPGSLPPPRAESLLRPSPRQSGEIDPSDLGGGRIAIGGTAYRARFALSEGFSTNITEEQTAAGVLVHPGFFTGLEAGLDILTLTSNTERQEFHFVFRGQHYVPTDGAGQIDDGTLYGTWNRSFTLTPRTRLDLFALGTLTSSNSALLADGPLFEIDPRNLTRVYTRENAGLSLSYELAPLWRFIASANAWVEATLHEQLFTDGSSPPIDHHGLDSISPIVEATVSHDFDPYNVGMVTLRYQPTYIAFLADYTRSPPSYDGTATNQAATAFASWTHAFGEEWRGMLSLGGTAAQAPPLDTNTQPIISPYANLVLSYAKLYWLATLTGTYAYGTTTPRFGFGPGEGASLQLQGIPYPHGQWTSLALVATALVSNTSLLQGNGSANLTFAGGNLDLRYAVNNWLGLIAEYNVHYASLEGASYPPLLRNVFLLGLSVYLADDRSLPTIQTLAISALPPI